jgi:3D (Asp-Asp-Asp) domain-containing protein
MKEFIIAITVVATVYNAVPEQCNADYLTTASMKKINPENPGAHRYVAVSRDLEKLGFVFGVKILVSGTGKYDGIWTIEDRMNKRYTRRIDFLVDNHIKYGKWENVKISIINHSKNN